MIELPEAVVIARQITDTIGGKTITNVIANSSPQKFAWFTGDPARYPDFLEGKMIRDAIAYGNLIEIHVDEMHLVISTPIKYHPAGTPMPKKHQLYLAFADGSAVSCTVQMCGFLFCFHRTEMGGQSDYHIAKQNPSPLSNSFDQVYFAVLFDGINPTLSAKEFLATKQRIPGLGNGVLQDILWTAHIHPKRILGDLTGLEKGTMFTALKQVLASMTDLGGRDTEKDLFGHLGGYKTILSRNTLGSPCPACTTPIRKEAYLGGAIYFCARCQKL